jgi:hypothetical protein
MSMLKQGFYSKQLYDLVIDNQEAARQILCPLLLANHLTQVE